MPETRKICIIGQGTIASNPRVVKEARALTEAGYRVHLIYTRHVPYLLKTDQEILEQNPQWTVDYKDWSGTSFQAKGIKLISGIRKRISDILLNMRLINGNPAPFLRSRFYKWQLRKAISARADLYIAHYPESIAVAAKAAEINKSSFAFDAEDFHRGENLPEKILRSVAIMEDSYLANAAYISAASPLIAEEYRKRFPDVPVISIENMFFLKEQPPYQTITNEIFKFFWFSQTIGPKRGLEEFIRIIGHIGKKNVQLSLLGNVDPNFRNILSDLWRNEGMITDKLVFISTVPEKEIFEIAARHHFGLALETPHSLSRDICLTNKLYTYTLSGNCLILSNTRAQNNFHNKFPQSGISIELNEPQESASKLEKFMSYADSIQDCRTYNYSLSKEILNFDREKEILLKQVESIWE